MHPVKLMMPSWALPSCPIYNFAPSNLLLVWFTSNFGPILATNPYAISLTKWKFSASQSWNTELLQRCWQSTTNYRHFPTFKEEQHRKEWTFSLRRFLNELKEDNERLSSKAVDFISHDRLYWACICKSWWFGSGNSLRCRVSIPRCVFHTGQSLGWIQAKVSHKEHYSSQYVGCLSRVTWPFGKSPKSTINRPIHEGLLRLTRFKRNWTKPR